MNKSTTTIFTDGSSLGNPGPGGWAAVLVESESAKAKKGPIVTELGGREARTTNNRMELKAAVEGLSHAPKKSSVILYTDSSYLINGITKWIHGWKRNDWKTKTKDDVLNKDLWIDLDHARTGKKVEWKRLGGHVGVVGNERCDHIATDLAAGVKVQLYKGPLAGYDLPNILDVSHDAEKLTVKKASSSRSRAIAYSYISSVNGVIEVHHSWPECERRVKGVKGARYKKSLDAGDEQDVIKEFGTF